MRNDAICVGLLIVCMAWTSPAALGGACCLPDGACHDVPEVVVCGWMGGLYRGDGTDCGSADCSGAVPGGHDCWWMNTSCEEATTAIEFGGDAQTPAIPEDFFGPGSDPFEGVVTFERGFCDTVMLRQGWLDMDPCGEVQIDIDQYCLTGCEPIVVTMNGGLSEQLWEVEHVGQWGVSTGTVHACRTHEDGGTFTTDMTWHAYVQFTPVAGGASLFLQLDPMTLIASDEPFLMGDECASLLMCNHEFCGGYRLDDEGLPCCEDVCFEDPDGSATSICYFPPPLICRRCPPQTGALLGDYNSDGHVDLVDFYVFSENIAGPDTMPDPPLPWNPAVSLSVFDFDEDGDLDLTDYAALMCLLTD